MDSLPPLPKDALADPRHAALTELLESHRRRLWEDGQVGVPTVPSTPALIGVLRRALSGGVAIQGLEQAAMTLAGEQKGLDAARRKSGDGGPVRPRISRVLFVANDGSTRFYRDCEGIARRYADRLLVCRIDLDGDPWGEALLGTPKLVRCVLVADKRAASDALLALLPTE